MEITRILEIEEIKRFKKGALGAGIETLSSLLKLTCHTQVTERAVKLLKEVFETDYMEWMKESLHCLNQIG